MLLDTMNPQEIRTIIGKELPNMIKRAEHIPVENHHLLVKNKSYPLSISVPWCSPTTKTKWHLVIIFYAKPKKIFPDMNFYTTYESPYGRGIFALPYDRYMHCFRIFKYTAHFFKRYRERYINIIAPEEKDRVVTSELQKLIITYYIVNNVYTFREITVNRQTKRFEGSIPDGTIFGIADANEQNNFDFFTVKTFVNNNMLFTDQKEQAEKRIQNMYSIYKMATNMAQQQSRNKPFHLPDKKNFNNFKS